MRKEVLTSGTEKRKMDNKQEKVEDAQGFHLGYRERCVCVGRGWVHRRLHREFQAVSLKVLTEGTVGIWRPTKVGGKSWAGSGPSLFKGKADR